MTYLDDRHDLISSYLILGVFGRACDLTCTPACDPTPITVSRHW